MACKTLCKAVRTPEPWGDPTAAQVAGWHTVDTSWYPRSAGDMKADEVEKYVKTLKGRVDMDTLLDFATHPAMKRFVLNPTLETKHEGNERGPRLGCPYLKGQECEI